MLEILKGTIIYVLQTLIHNAPSLIIGIIIACVIKVYVDPEKFKSLLLRNKNVSIPGSVAFGAFTPFCACGTMAVIVSLLATSLPWGPIMAFLTSSPLMSPDEFVMISGIISFKFAVVLTIASIIIGLGSGYITHIIEKKTKFLDNQIRFADECSCTKEKTNCCSNETTLVNSEYNQVSCCSSTDNSVNCSCSNGKINYTSMIEKYKIKELLKVIVDIGIKKVLVYFMLFAAVGYFINEFIPSEYIVRYLGINNIFAVPVSALIGLPLYVSGPSSLPILKVLMDNGASSGAMLAFMITGPGTSAGAIAGITTIMKKRAIGLYIAFLLVGAIILGYLYDFLLAFGL